LIFRAEKKLRQRFQAEYNGGRYGKKNKATAFARYRFIIFYILFLCLKTKN